MAFSPLASIPQAHFHIRAERYAPEHRARVGQWLLDREAALPGVMAYGRLDRSWKWFRLEKVEDEQAQSALPAWMTGIPDARAARKVNPDLGKFNYWTLVCPISAIEFLRLDLDRARIPYSEHLLFGAEHLKPLPDRDSEDYEQCVRIGEKAMLVALARGELTERGFELANRYQKFNPGWVLGGHTASPSAGGLDGGQWAPPATDIETCNGGPVLPAGPLPTTDSLPGQPGYHPRPYDYLGWPGGSGKTLGAMLDIASCFPSSPEDRCPVLVVAPSKVRGGWVRQMAAFTGWNGYALLPKTEREKIKGYPTLTEYLRDVEGRPVVVAGLELLGDWLEEVEELAPSIMVLDEIHNFSSSARFKAIPMQDGGVSFETRKTKASQGEGAKFDRVTRGVAAMMCSRRDLVFRLGMSATPLIDGLPKSMWAQGDLLAPGEFSYSYSKKFAPAYAQAKAGQHGGLDDQGAARQAELRTRFKWMRHEVTLSESHAGLPPCRHEVVYLEPDQQDSRKKIPPEVREAVKAAEREWRKNRGDEAYGNLREAQKAEAAAAKTTFVVGTIIEQLAGRLADGTGGPKITLFTNRHEDCERWGALLQAAIDEAREKGALPDRGVQMWVAHGGNTTADERSDLADTYGKHPGPCVLVSTGHAFGEGVDGLQSTDHAWVVALPDGIGTLRQWWWRFDRLEGIYAGRPTIMWTVVAVGTIDDVEINRMVERGRNVQRFEAAEDLKDVAPKLAGTYDREKLVAEIGAMLKKNLGLS